MRPLTIPLLFSPTTFCPPVIHDHPRRQHLAFTSNQPLSGSSTTIGKYILSSDPTSASSIDKLPPTDPWRTKKGKVPGEDAWRQGRALTTTSNHDRRLHQGERFDGCGIDLRSILQKRNVGASGEGQFNPAKCGGFEPDDNIVWIQHPRKTFDIDQQLQFSQVQAIIRDRLRRLGLDYAVVRAGPHTTQNEHDDIGTVVKITNHITGHEQNSITKADLHITLYAGKKNGSRGEELYLQGHIYLERAQRSESDDEGEFDYVYLADPSRRQYPKPGEPPVSEEWWLTENTHKKSS